MPLSPTVTVEGGASCGHATAGGFRFSRGGGIAVCMNFNQEPAALPDGSTVDPVSFEFSG